MSDMRRETDSLGVVDVPADKLWGAQTQRSLEHFSIGQDLIPREMIIAYAILKKVAAAANHASQRLEEAKYKLIVQTCEEILAGQHHDMFPLHVWMTGSGTQFNMNVNEVISNRCCQLAGTPLGSKTPVHPNDHVNMAQSSNDSFPSAMYIAAAVNVKQRLLPAVTALRPPIEAKSQAWKDVVKIGRTHMQGATPLTLGQEWSGYAGMLEDDAERVEGALQGVYRLALGGTAVGTGINVDPVFCAALLLVGYTNSSVGFGGAHWCNSGLSTGALSLPGAPLGSLLVFSCRSSSAPGQWRRDPAADLARAEGEKSEHTHSFVPTGWQMVAHRHALSRWQLDSVRPDADSLFPLNDLRGYRALSAFGTTIAPDKGLRG